MLRAIGRSALRSWGRTGIVLGYQYRAVEQLGPTLGEPRTLETRLPNGCRIRCNLEDHVQRHQWFFGVYEPVESYLFTRLLKPGMTVIDAGANVGQYTLLASTAVGASGTVHAFEPVPQNFARLQEATAANHQTNVRLNPLALWHEDTTLTLGLEATDALGTNAGSFSVGSHPADAASRIEARAVRLDSYAASEGIEKVGVIKMDIEGAEPHALEGAREVLAKSRPSLLMEVNRKALVEAGSSPEKLWEGLAKLGYRAWEVDITPEKCGPITDFSKVDRANIIAHVEDLPADVTGGWDFRSIRRWARGGLVRAED